MADLISKVPLSHPFWRVDDKVGETARIVFLQPAQLHSLLLNRPRCAVSICILNLCGSPMMFLVQPSNVHGFWAFRVSLSRWSVSLRGYIMMIWHSHHTVMSG